MNNKTTFARLVSTAIKSRQNQTKCQTKFKQGRYKIKQSAKQTYEQNRENTHITCDIAQTPVKHPYLPIDKLVFLKNLREKDITLSEESMHFLYELYEERAAIIEHDGSYSREVAQKLALEEIRRLALAKAHGMHGNTIAGLEVSSDIVLSYKDGKIPGAIEADEVIKGIPLNRPDINAFLRGK